MKKDLQIWKRIAKPKEAEEQKEVWFGNKITRRVCSNEQKNEVWDWDWLFGLLNLVSLLVREIFLASIYVYMWGEIMSSKL